MNLESQVTSLELSKRLCELGVKQESQFYYCNAKMIGDYVLENELWMIAHLSQVTGLSQDWYSAFTASDLLEILPCDVNNGLCLKIQKHDVMNEGITYFIEYGYASYESQDESLSNALAKMLIYLIENKLIEV